VPETLQDAHASPLELACADSQGSGDLIGRGALQQHRDDRSIAILCAI
jgi:hypothetical protein